MALRSTRSATHPETAALKAQGESVTARLAADPAAYRLPVDGLVIFGIADFFSATECQRLMATVDAVAKPSAVFGGTGASQGRTSFSGDVDPQDPFIQMLQRRIDDLLGINSRFGETIQGQRYQPGQEFRAHYDWFDTGGEYWEEENRAGQRTWTAMAYLNAVEEGGSTDFPKINLSVPPQPGALLVWNNMSPDGTPNRNALHAGTPVKRGVKYVLTKWYRARPWW
ncbi:MAG TPA: 2OG-Fe(II) oxygenase [Legionella sp.]|nr:2OG-Fe(II) oxygenase [Legionella sp.]